MPLSFLSTCRCRPRLNLHVAERSLALRWTRQRYTDVTCTQTLRYVFVTIWDSTRPIGQRVWHFHCNRLSSLTWCPLSCLCVGQAYGQMSLWQSVCYVSVRSLLGRVRACVRGWLSVCLLSWQASCPSVPAAPDATPPSERPPHCGPVTAAGRAPGYRRPVGPRDSESFVELSSMNRDGAEWPRPSRSTCGTPTDTLRRPPLVSLGCHWHIAHSTRGLLAQLAWYC